MDRDGNRSNPYKPNPEQCCEACVFGSGEHAEWCSDKAVLTKDMIAAGLTEFEKICASRAEGCPSCAVPGSDIYDCAWPDCDCYECHEE